MSIVDPQSDIEGLNWNDHWDRYSKATRMNPGQHYRRKAILKLLGNSARQKGTRILDVGCGAGDLLETVADHCPQAEMAGIDQSNGGLKHTRQLLPDARLLEVDLESCDVDAGELKNWASHAVCSEVLEHIEHPVAALENIAKFLRPGGALVITVPGGPKSAFDKSIGHFRHYKPEELHSDLINAGYDIELVSGAGFPVFNLYRLVILLRGDKLRQDIADEPSPLARFVMAVFRSIISCSLLRSPWGWQIVAIAHKRTEQG
jgi:SAM-dependent methyltransferase